MIDKQQGLNNNPKILVHICCAPDGLYVMEILRKDYNVSGFFYNPNIHPFSEYKLRLEETKKVSHLLSFDLIEGDYDAHRWFKITQKYKNEPEKGRRCDICYALRLKKTAETAARLHFDLFTTVMSLSPWKKADVLNRIGKMFGQRHGIDFLEANFKKKDGFRKSVILSRQYGLYRQNYCGCQYSQHQS